MHWLRCLAMALCLLVPACAALAEESCDFTNAAPASALSAEAFFARPKGALAIGQGCDLGSNLCKSYIEIGQCDEVVYPLWNSGKAGSVFFSFNTVNTCASDCTLVDSFLAATLVFENGSSADPVAPFADLYRNASQNWSAFRRSALASAACCRPVLTPPQFIGTQAADASVDALFKATSIAWHSAFSSTLYKNVLTWDYRSVFLAWLTTCGDCSGKFMLYRFAETPRNAPHTQPNKPMLFSGKVMSFPDFRLKTTVPLTDDSYDYDVLIRLVR